MITTDGMCTRDELRRLAEETGPCRVSIYMPTHRKGAETRADPIRMKNLVAAAKRRAEELGVKHDVEKMLAPALEFPPEFWRHQDHGLALIAAPDQELRVHRLPYGVKELAEVGERPVVRPLVRAKHDASRFLLLALSKNSVRLLDCTAESFDELDISDGPTSLQDAVGHDFEEKSLQFHTGTADTGKADRPASFHGHGRADQDPTQEVAQFVRRLDSHIMDKLDGQKPPMLIAATERVAVEYRQGSEYPEIMEAVIEGSPEPISSRDLHEKAVKLVKAREESEVSKRMSAVRDAVNAKRAAISAAEVFKALDEGRVATLVVDTDGPLWGKIENGRVTLHDERGAESVDLAEEAVRKALLTDAEIIPLRADAIPGEGVMVATLRY